MSRNRIDQPLFPEHDGLSFSFNMINHIADEKYSDTVFQEICNTVSKCYKSKLPISSRLLGSYRIYPISSNHTLYQYLDEEAKKNQNFLIFLQKDNNILVTWFGPFVDRSLLGDIYERLVRSHEILKEIKKAVRVGENDMVGEEEMASNKKELVDKYWKYVKETLAKIEAKKIELKGNLEITSEVISW